MDAFSDKSFICSQALLSSDSSCAVLFSRLPRILLSNSRAVEALVPVWLALVSSARRAINSCKTTACKLFRKNVVKRGYAYEGQFFYGKALSLLKHRIILLRLPYSLLCSTLRFISRVPTLLSSSNSMTFDDLFKFSMTLGLAITFENFQNRPCFKVFYRHQLLLWCPNASYSRSLITPLYLTLSLLCHLQQLIYQTKLSFYMTFKDRQLNFTTFQAWKLNFLNSMTFQVFHDLCEPWISWSDKPARQNASFFWLCKNDLHLSTG